MNSSKRNLPHQWSDDERLILCLIGTFYSIESKSTSAIFNQVYKDRLSQEGHPEGLRATTIQTMYYELRFRRSNNEPWKTIGSLSLARLRHKFWKEKNEIEDSAFDLGIELVLRKKEDHRPQSTLHSRLRKVQSVDTTREDTPSSDYSAYSSSCEDIICKPRKGATTRRQWKSSNTTITPKVQLYTTTQGDGTPGLKRPVLLFRAFETAHRFRSRMHQGTDPLPPPAYHSVQFRDLVKQHLMIETDFQSPFISFTQSTRAAIKYLEDRESCSLAVFEYNALQSDALQRFNTDEIPYLVPSICRNHDIDDLPRAYTGRGEWLCWSSIRAQPIAIWTLSQVKAIENCMKVMESISYDSGVTLGKCLIDVSFQWRATVAYKLLWAYKIDGYLRGSKTKAFNEFVRGLYHDESSEDPSSMTTETSPHNSKYFINRPIQEIQEIDTTESDDSCPVYSTMPARNRRCLTDSEDETIAGESPARITDSQQANTQIAFVNFKTFRERIIQFTAGDSSKSEPKHNTSSFQMTFPSTHTETDDLYRATPKLHLRDPWNVVDLTKEEKEDVLDDEVVFQSARHAVAHSKALSIRSRSSTREMQD